MNPRAAAALTALALLAATAAPAPAQQADTFASPTHFAATDGAALYRDICQGCHMARGQGAKGAGTYPALAKDANLAAAGYPVLIVLEGRRAMPGFAATLDDAQIAAVVNYVRANFGNGYSDAVSAADVAAVRPKE
jgi:mono/diheme cytochrome c family protein